MVRDTEVQYGQIETTTQLGKSLVLALSAIWVAKFQNQDVAIVAPTDKQAGIIMEYVIDHLADHPSFSEGLVDDLTVLDKFKAKRSSQQIKWADAGSIKCYTVGALNKKGLKGQKLMGLHATLIIMDEAGLVPNDHFNKVFRMLAGKLSKSKLIKVGNPWYSRDEETGQDHHFYISHLDNSYQLIHIDYKEAIRQGRLTQSYIDKAREQMKGSSNDFRVLFEVLFPEKGSQFTIFDDDLLRTIPTFKLEDLAGKNTLKFAGGDISGRGNDDTILSRIIVDGTNVYLRKQIQITGEKLTDKAEKIHDEIQKKDDHDNAIGIDVIGVGEGVGDILEDRSDRLYFVHNYIASASVEDPTKKNKQKEKITKLTYYNKKTELVYKLKMLIQNVRFFVEEGFDFGQLFKEMLLLIERTTANNKRKVEDPPDSPDHVDSLLSALFASQFYNVIT